MRISDWSSDVCSSDLLAFRIWDLGALGLVGWAAFFMRQVDDSELHFPLYLGAILLATVVATAMLHRFDVYREDFLYSKRIPYGSLFAAWTVTFCILLAAAFLMKMSESYSRAWALSWFVGGGVGLAAGRMVLRHWVQELSLAGRFANRTVIVGAGDQGRRLAGYLQRHGDANIRLVGFVDDRATRELVRAHV